MRILQRHNTGILMKRGDLFTGYGGGSTLIRLAQARHVSTVRGGPAERLSAYSAANPPCRGICCRQKPHTPRPAPSRKSTKPDQRPACAARRLRASAGCRGRLLSSTGTAWEKDTNRL